MCVDTLEIVSSDEDGLVLGFAVVCDGRVSFVIVDTVLLREASGDDSVFALDGPAIGIVLGLENVLGVDNVCSLWNDDFFQSSVLDEGVELPLNGINPFLTFGLELRHT